MGVGVALHKLFFEIACMSTGLAKRLFGSVAYVILELSRVHWNRIGVASSRMESNRRCKRMEKSCQVGLVLVVWALRRNQACHRQKQGRR